MTNIEQNTHKTLTRATVTIALFSLLSKLIGLLRDRIFASSFGAGDTLDIYYAAFRVPDFIFNMLILGAFAAAFLPVFTATLNQDRARAFDLAATVLNATVIVMGVLCLILVIFTPVLVKLIVPGFTTANQAETASLTRIMLLSPLLFAISSVFSSVLNSFKKFTLVAAMPIIYNLALILGVIVLYPAFGINGLAYGVIIGAFLHAALQIFSVRKLGFRWKMLLNTKDPEARKIWRLYVPRAFGAGGLNQISFFISAVIGSTLAVGSIAIYNLANNLQIVPIGVFALAFATVAFPHLAEAAAKNDQKTFKDVFNINLSQILFLIIPFSVLMLILRAQIIRLVLGAGQFGWDDTVLTIQTFGFFALSLFAQSLIPLFSRAFFAMQNTVIPVVTGFIAAGANVVGAIFFTNFFGVAGLALAFTVAAIVNFVLLFILLEVKFGNIVDNELIFKLEKIILATLAAGILCYTALFAIEPFLDTRTFFGLLLQAVAATLVGGLVYLGMGWILNIGESRHLISASRNWLNKIRNAFAKTSSGL